MSTIEVLIEARELVRRGWTQHTFARDANGRPCPSISAEAVAFCGEGAICRVVGGATNAHFRAAFDAYRECIDGPVPEWNDQATHEEVLAHFDETIATLRSREGAYA